ncbi:hypothetical protein D6D02_08115 [Aureobasidium pullulans]|uniref:BRCT domain-containing protein n=1 Tax=Aureobasidium pullulans TaxID=5580 RepID=A0A4S8ZEV0_AURPU|nr:hypothetical protein D6D23_05392 [Aureobasidium pullulans]THW64270.1 hypothetical protein D6D20_02935 [Aureobasidium pullulans]THY03623.1 hypothetical protein D6D02_08115 [Aureobasidium pullulans]
MSSWNLHILDSDGKHIGSHHQAITSLTRQSVFIKGKTQQPSTWRFTDYHDETQAKSDWVVLFEFEGGGIKLSTDIPDTFIKSALPAHPLVSRIRLPCTIDKTNHFAILRHDDCLEFDNLAASVKIDFESNTTNLDVQVESSGPGAATHRIKREKVKEEVDSDEDEETDDESFQPPADVRRGTSAEESQHLFSTSRENLSPTPRPTTRESQIVQDTPNQRRFRSQHESTIPESLPMDQPQPEQPEPAFAPNAVESTFAALPDIHTGELPNTSPSDMLAFQLPKEPTPSPMESLSAEQVGELVYNLNDGNPPSQAPMTITSPKRAPKSILVSRQLHEDSSTEEPVKAAGSPDSPELQDAAASVESAIIEPEHSPSPVDIINGEITNDHAATGSDGDLAATVEPSPVLPKTKHRTPVAAVKKRKVTDSSGPAASAKRAKFTEDETSTTSTTPLSTASRRSSGKTKGLQTPSGSRSSSRRKSVDDEVPPGSISRRVSNRHRSVESESATSGSPALTGREYTGPPPVIIYSNTKVYERAMLMKFMKSHGATRTEDIKSANFLCVGGGELLKTPKLLHSLTLGKTIVTDDWVSQSVTAGRLLDTDEFLPEELKATKHMDRTGIFTDQVIYVSPTQRIAYKKGWDDVMAIVRQAGGTDPQTGPLAKLDNMDMITLYIGADKDDDVVAELQEMGETVYKKDILGASIVAGELQLDESLELPAVELTVKEEPKTTKATPKSAKKAGRKKKA